MITERLGIEISKALRFAHDFSASGGLRLRLPGDLRVIARGGPPPPPAPSAALLRAAA